MRRLKTCSKCKKQKTLSLFNKNRCNKDGLQRLCRSCQGKCTQQHYLKNKSAYAKNRAKNKARIVGWFQNYKSTLQCLKCNENHPACLQFHHRDPAQKVLAISTGITQGWSIERLKEEISKCDVLCANCHAKHHYEDLHNSL